MTWPCRFGNFATMVYKVVWRKLPSMNILVKNSNSKFSQKVGCLGKVWYEVWGTDVFVSLVESKFLMLISRSRFMWVINFSRSWFKGKLWRGCFEESGSIPWWLKCWKKCAISTCECPFLPACFNKIMNRYLHFFLANLLSPLKECVLIWNKSSIKY